MIDSLLFALTLLLVGGVPLPYGYDTHRASLEAAAQDATLDAQALAWQAGALLVAENRGRRYLVDTIGRYGATAGTPSAERGLFQIAPGSWAKRCGVKRRQLFTAHHNTRCALVVITSIQKEARRRGRAWADWRAGWRCHPSARSGKRCARNIARVLRIENRLIRAYKARFQARFWLRAAGYTAPALVRSLGVTWRRLPRANP